MDNKKVILEDIYGSSNVSSSDIARLLILNFNEINMKMIMLYYEISFSYIKRQLNYILILLLVLLMNLLIENMVNR